EVALREERPGEACRGYKDRLQKDAKDEGAWAGLLTVSARTTCLNREQGDALALWAATRDTGIWAGARAEWAAFKGEEEAARALLPSASADARLRVGMRLGDGDLVLDAAEDVLIQTPGNLMACRTIVNQLMQRADLFAALEEARCGGVGTPDLQRLTGVALDLAGMTEDAEKIFRDGQASVHLATLLYQENPTPERLEEARKLLAADGMPPARLHQGWMALLGQGPPPPLESLGDNPDSQLVRAALRFSELSDEELADLSNGPGAAPFLLQARIAAAKGKKSLALAALKQARERDPTFEPVFRGGIGVLLELKEDPGPWLADWKALDPDHVRLRGPRDRREVVWAALVPWTWAELVRRNPRLPAEFPPPEGKDAVGDAWRAAMALPDRNARLDALATLLHQEPTLHELAGYRYRIEAGLPLQEDAKAQSSP
ncbi:MAG TPA: hypothetical protein PKW90_14970, partial [Myxococcota bacterium]|nr:hypothetical protein [Myxococcota bacterium]